jgi:Mor transcription activator family
MNEFSRELLASIDPETELSRGLKGLVQSIGTENAQLVCREFPSENLYIYKLWSKNRRLLAILTEDVVKKIVSDFGGAIIVVPKGAKWIREERNQQIVEDRKAVLVGGKLQPKMSIPAIVKKYKLSRTAIHTILRLEKAKLKALDN